MATISLRPSQAAKLVTSYLAERIPVLLTGAPGVGKSSIVEQAAKAAGYDVILSHPVVSDPTDFKGLPWPGKDGEHATFLPFGELARAIEAKKPTVWFLDDLGQSSPAVQAACMQLLLARRVNGHVLPDCVTFVAATNRRQDRAGVTGILTPVLSRFGAVVGVEPTVEDWCQWALGNGVPAEVVAFIRFRPNLLNVQIGQNAGRKADDMENFPCPRTWEFAGKALKMGLDHDLEFAAIAGAVGEGAAVEFNAFLKLLRSNLPNPDSIILDPDNAPIPERPDILWAVTAALAKRASATNCGRIFRYGERLFETGHGEFAALMIKDINNLHPDVLHTPEWTAMSLSEFGKSFLG